MPFVLIISRNSLMKFLFFINLRTPNFVGTYIYQIPLYFVKIGNVIKGPKNTNILDNKIFRSKVRKWSFKSHDRFHNAVHLTQLILILLSEINHIMGPNAVNQWFSTFEVDRTKKIRQIKKFDDPNRTVNHDLATQ